MNYKHGLFIVSFRACFDPQMIGFGCIGFSYHMYGQHIGTLRAFTEEVREGFHEGYNRMEKWIESGDMGNQWFNANFSVHLGSELGKSVVR